MRFFRTFLFSLLTLSALYIALIVMVNPRGDFGGTRFPWLYANTRKVKLALYQKYSSEGPVEIVFIGSSRTMMLDPHQVETVEGMRAFNFAVFSATPEDYLAIYRWLRRTHHLPRLLVVGVDLGVFGAGAETHEELRNNLTLVAELDPRLLHSIPAALHRISLLKRTMTATYARDAVRSVRLSITRTEPFNTFRPDGAVEYPVTDREIAAGTFQRARAWDVCAGGAITLMTASLRDSISSERLRLLGTLLEETRRDKVRIVVWVTPTDPELARRLAAQPQIWQRAEEARRRLDSVTTSHQVKLLDLSNPASFGAQTDKWYDCQHYHRADADRIARLLLRAAPVDSTTVR